MSTHDNDTMESDDGKYEAVHGKKRRKTCPSKALQDGANLQVGCTVLHTPTDNQKIDSLSKFRLTDFLNNAAPGMVTVVRVNKARNILAVDVKRPAFKAELLKVTKLCTVPVRAYLPREHSGSFGVLRDIDPDYSENDIKTQLQSSIGIVEVKRLGKTSPLLDLTKYCSERADFAGVQVRTRRKDIVIVSAYIHPLGKWRPHVLAEMREELGTDKDILIGGDFNAHNESWGDGKTTARGRRLQKLLDTTNFEEIGTGTPTFLRTDTQQSVIDLTFTAGTLGPLRATPQPDGWGSDHTPITLRKKGTKRRSHLSSLRASGQPLTTRAMAEALRLATHTVSVTTNRPNPDLEWLELRAKRRQAQRRVKRTRVPEDKVTREHKRMENGKELDMQTGTKTPHHRHGHQAAYYHTSCDRTHRGRTTQYPEDLHLHELKRALASLPRKKSAPKPDGVTNQALRNLEEDALPDLLAYLNEVWTTACLPADWKMATVVPLLKPGKPSDQPNSYRPIALTSCVGKLLERIILCRLVHHLEIVGGLPECYAGFRRGRCTADAIADLVTALEDGKARHRTTGVVLLDISKVFDAVEHNSIVTELKRLGIGGRMLAFIRAFLEGREAQVSAAGVCSTVRRMTRGVPKGSVLSPLLFSVALAALPQAARIGERTNRPVHMAVYAEDIAIWAADRGCCRKNVQNELQRALDNIYYFLTTLGLTLSAAKSVALLNAPHRTYKFTLSLQIAGTPVPIVKQATYLGLKLDDRVSWQPAVSTVLNNNKKTTSILRILGG
ncbi:hypothetical protein HPB47_026989 [Ixodes persulcatus]|uniref:Uncharacterized protein n=1 Tax=Ixodes persulcatus TaxID=34615 RepID=A0AC60PX71_IXOPE|nr:hypothetical protein HPB47_026989 [Ixodes persulcatus]